MRHVMAVCGVIGLCLVVAGFWLAGKSRAALNSGVLSAQVDRIVSGWTAQNTPEEDRTIDLVISDAAAPSGEKAEAQSAYSSEELDVLDSANEPPFGTKLSAWFHRTFFRRSMAAPKNTAFAAALANKPGAVTWTHEGYKTASGDEMAAEIERAILKAEEALASVNIITDGVAAAPALKAVRMLKSAKLKGGGSAAINKFMAVNMNRATLKRLDPAGFRSFTKPDNLREWVSIWNPRGESKNTAIELFSPQYNGKRFDGGELFPMMGARAESNSQSVLQLVQVMAKKTYTMEQVIGHLAAKAEEQKKKVTVVTRDLKGRSYQREMETDTANPAAPLDSLSALQGGWLKEETEKAARDEGGDGGPGSRPAGSSKYPLMDWDEAVKRCRGKLPSVDELKIYDRDECTGGMKSDSCNKSFWASNEDGLGNASYVYFDGKGFTSGKPKAGANNVRCQEPPRPKWERYDIGCGRCCADLGGAWNKRRHCCAGADFRQAVPSCQAAVDNRSCGCGWADGDCGYYIKRKIDWFRCDAPLK